MSLSRDFVPIDQLISLKGKTAIVTGAAMGIGQTIAHRLGEAGANLVVGDVQAERGQRSAAALAEAGYPVRFLLGDVSREEAMKALVDAAVKEFGGVDILVNNAALAPFASALDMSGADFLKVVDVNVKAPFIGIREVSRQMTAQGRGGSIVNLSSVAGIHPSRLHHCAYDASKGAVITLTKSLARELGPHRIRVNAICPGAILTERMQALVRRGVFGDFKDGMKDFTARTSVGRMGYTDEIARVALFLASDMSSYMTGSFVVVDGGFLLS
jgi:NAD(P)-dependent dehydrogenase (short-subunit alcohol dehydrogenase family)